jgi:hypothetical protein
MINSDELIFTTGYRTLQARCRLNRCRYNWVRVYFKSIRNGGHCVFCDMAIAFEILFLWIPDFKALKRMTLVNEELHEKRNESWDPSNARHTDSWTDCIERWNLQSGQLLLGQDSNVTTRTRSDVLAVREPTVDMAVFILLKPSGNFTYHQV